MDDALKQFPLELILEFRLQMEYGCPPKGSGSCRESRVFVGWPGNQEILFLQKCFLSLKQTDLQIKFWS